MFSTPQFDAMRKTRSMTRDALLRPKVYELMLVRVAKRLNCEIADINKHTQPGDINDLTLYLLANSPSHLTRYDMIDILNNWRSKGKFHLYRKGGNLWRSFTQEAVMLIDVAIRRCVS